MQSTSEKNISQLNILLLPIIIVAKIVRYTIMYNVLVALSIGHTMVGQINKHDIVPFHMSFIAEESESHIGVGQTNAVAFFDAINIFGFTDYLQWEVFFTIVFNILLYLLVRKYYRLTPSAGKWENIFIYMALAILNIFCLNIAKEPYQLIFFLLMGWGITKFKGYNRKTIWLLFVCVLCILFARKYYILVCVFYIAIQVLVAKLFLNIDTSTGKGKFQLFIRLIYTLLILAACHYVLYSYIASNNAETYQELAAVNDRDQNRSSKAVSEIVPWFGSSNQLMVTLEFFVKIFRLSFPIELLLIGKFTYIVIISYLSLLVYFVIKAFAVATKDEEEDDEEEESEYEEAMEEEENDAEEDEEEETDDDDGENMVPESYDRKQMRKAALYLYIAFLLCSACFEPDFGSWTRHIGVVFPVILFIL